MIAMIIIYMFILLPIYGWPSKRKRQRILETRCGLNRQDGKRESEKSKCNAKLVKRQKSEITKAVFIAEQSVLTIRTKASLLKLSIKGNHIIITIVNA